MTLFEIEEGVNPRASSAGHLTPRDRRGPHYPCTALLTSLRVMRPSTPEPLTSWSSTPSLSAFCLAAFVAYGFSSGQLAH